MEKFFTWVFLIALFAAMGFSGAMLGGTRSRQRFEQETVENRSWRIKVAWICLGVALLAGLIAWAFSRAAA